VYVVILADRNGALLPRAVEHLNDCAGQLYEEPLRQCTLACLRGLALVPTIVIIKTGIKSERNLLSTEHNARTWVCFWVCFLDPSLRQKTEA
jgi:hypothetical protein